MLCGFSRVVERLVEILKDFPLTETPVSLLYPRNRQLSPRVRVFIDWLVKLFAQQRASFG